MGRFLTPDWSAKAEPVPYSKLDDPQSLNLYAYVGNNPFIRLDADGHSCKGSGGSSAACNAVRKAKAAKKTTMKFLAKHKQAVHNIMATIQFATIVSGAFDEGASELLVPEEESLEVSVESAIDEAVTEGAAAGTEGASEPSSLPSNPDKLLENGYQETSHPDAAAAGHRTFENSGTGDRLRFDQGKPGKPRWEGQDHYHRYNPNSTGKADQYLDSSGKPAARGSDESHLLPNTN